MLQSQVLLLSTHRHGHRYTHSPSVVSCSVCVILVSVAMLSITAVTCISSCHARYRWKRFWLGRRWAAAPLPPPSSAAPPAAGTRPTTPATCAQSKHATTAAFCASPPLTLTSLTTAMTMRMRWWWATAALWGHPCGKAQNQVGAEGIHCFCSVVVWV